MATANPTSRALFTALALVPLMACSSPQDLGGISRIQYNPDTKAFLYEGGKQFGEIKIDVNRRPDGSISTSITIIGVEAFEGQSIQQERLIRRMEAIENAVPGLVKGAVEGAICAVLPATCP